MPFCISRYNRSPQASTGETPNWLVKLRDPLEPTDLRPPMRYRALEDENDIFAQRYSDAYELCKANQVLAKDKQKRFYDKGTKLVTYEVDDKILLHILKTQTAKFYDRWEGPFIVVRKISDINYLVRAVNKEHTFVVHVNRMKKSFQERRADLGLEGQSATENTEPAASTSLVEERNDTEAAAPKQAVAPPLRSRLEKRRSPPATSDSTQRNNLPTLLEEEEIDMPATDEPAEETSAAQQAVRLDANTPNDTLGGDEEKSDTGETVRRRPGRPKGTTKEFMQSRRKENVNNPEGAPTALAERAQGHTYGLRKAPRQTDRL